MDLLDIFFLISGSNALPTSDTALRISPQTELTRNFGVVDERAHFDFESLVGAIGRVHGQSAAHAGRAVNVVVTLRNWVVGLYIREYEQHGSDRAKYGAGLLDTLSRRLSQNGMTSMAPRSLRQYRQFYMVYPEIWQTPAAISAAGVGVTSMWQTLSAELRALIPAGDVTAEREAAPCARTISGGVSLALRLSFSQFAELITIDDPMKRAFYEIECMRGNWSVRELKRQIGALYFERSGLSKNREKLAAVVRAGAQAAEPHLSVRDPYVFEFLGLKTQEVMGESRLEDALLDRLQTFMMELGHGFCFEARQKRILIGDTYGFVDLVFYHRILKCHVLIELKISDFNHEHLGQLNTYVSWFRRHMMTEGDSAPVGLLLCTRKDHALVEYALADLSNNLFVSKYQVELPSREQLQAFIDAQIMERPR